MDSVMDLGDAGDAAGDDAAAPLSPRSSAAPAPPKRSFSAVWRTSDLKAELELVSKKPHTDAAPFVNVKTVSGLTFRVESADEPLTLALVKDALAERFGIEMQPHYVFFLQQTIVDNDYAVLPPGHTVYMMCQFGVGR